MEQSIGVAHTETELEQKGLVEFKDDVTTEQNISTKTLNAEELHEAEVWGLTHEEEKRYLFLKENKAKIFYKGLRLNPINILGLNARNDKERVHLAKLSAKVENQKIAQELAWNSAFHKATIELNKGTPVVRDFDTRKANPLEKRPYELIEGDTLNFFIKKEDSIKTVLYPLIDSILKIRNGRLNLYLVDGDEMSTQLWANQNSLPIKLVTENQITITYGDLEYKNLKLKSQTTPLLLLSRGNASQVIKMGAF